MSGNEKSQNIRKSCSRGIRSNYSQDATITLKNTEDGGLLMILDFGMGGEDFRNYAHCIASKMVERYAEANDDIDIWVV